MNIVDLEFHLDCFESTVFCMSNSIAQVAKVFGINSVSNAIEIVPGEARYYTL